MFGLRKIRNLDERRRRVGIFVSGTVHGSLIAAIIGCRIMGVEVPVFDAMTGKAKPFVRVEYWEREEFADVTKIVDDQVRQLIRPNEEKTVAAAQLTLSPAGEPQVANVSPPPATEAVSVDEFVKKRVERAAEESAKVDTNTKLSQLEKRAQDLNQISSEESINELSDKFKKWLGNEKRADKPAEKPVKGPFDFDTAQVHDVRREGSEKEGYKYTSILVDAAGRTFETPLNKEDGETAYSTMQLIKSNPLLEKVYRGIVMGMLDKMTKPEKSKKQK